MLTDPRYGLFAAEVERFVKETATGWVMARMFGVLVALFVCTAVYVVGYAAFVATGSLYASLIAWAVVIVVSVWGERRLSQ